MYDADEIATCETIKMKKKFSPLYIQKILALFVSNIVYQIKWGILT